MLTPLKCKKCGFLLAKDDDSARDFHKETNVEIIERMKFSATIPLKCVGCLEQLRRNPEAFRDPSFKYWLTIQLVHSGVEMKLIRASKRQVVIQFDTEEIDL